MAERLTAESANPSLASSAARSVFTAACAAAFGGYVLAAALGLDSAYPLRAAAAFLIGVAIVLPQVMRLRHPFAELGSANHATLARGVLTALIAALIGQTLTGAAGYFAVVAGASCLVLD